MELGEGAEGLGAVRAPFSHNISYPSSLSEILADLESWG